MRFHKLIINEWLKLFNRPRTYIFLAIPLLCIVVLGIMSKMYEQSESQQGGKEWRETIQAKILIDKKELQKQKKEKEDPVFIEMTESSIKQNEYALEHNISPFETTVWKFVKDTSYINSLIGLFVLIIASESVSKEFSQGTIKMLLIRPYHRWKILLSKLVTVILFALSAFMVVLVFSWLVGGLLYGFGGFGQPYVIEDHGQVATAIYSHYVLKSIGLEVIEFVFLILLTFMISTLFKSSALAITTSICTLFIGNIGVILLSAKAWAKYIFIAHMGLTGYLDGSAPFEGVTLSYSLIVLSLYSVLFLAIMFIFFQRRDVRS
ncbi:putative protein yhcI [Fictibacillus macauensis ZFHKF-1]|uniref:ABC transporter permease n=1 Tax=Fictibacillus macauensis ZFHKF-1 TaxID=1196324 RepID=I8IWM6_9BACL|nr:ABC transporter permease subunit [Fictibacillus macauensis]EIT83901.1 putative protein yhcI [Fictibacillus macauensis ZFHKF-1]